MSSTDLTTRAGTPRDPRENYSIKYNIQAVSSLRTRWERWLQIFNIDWLIVLYSTYNNKHTKNNVTRILYYLD